MVARRADEPSDRAHDEAIALTQEDYLRARREERYVRAALDRALDELEGLRAELEAGGAGPVRASDDALGMLGLDSGGGRRDQALRRLQDKVNDEQRARRAIQESLSWRITRPLRAGKAALAGPRHRLRALASARGRGPAK